MYRVAKMFLSSRSLAAKKPLIIGNDLGRYGILHLLHPVSLFQPTTFGVPFLLFKMSLNALGLCCHVSFKEPNASAIAESMHIEAETFF